MGFFNEYWRRHNKTEEERDEEHFAAIFDRLTTDTPPAAYRRGAAPRDSYDDQDSARAYYSAYYQI